jgi:hypothetical protein
MALAPSFTPEMWRALELLRMEQTSWSVCSGGSETGVLVSDRKPGDSAVVPPKRQVLGRDLAGFR